MEIRNLESRGPEDATKGPRLSKFRISIGRAASNRFRPQSRAWSALAYAKLASFDGRSP